MRKIKASQIKKVVSELCIEANTSLRKDVLSALKRSLVVERRAMARKILKILIENSSIASKKRIPICQDTGIPVIFIEIGSQVSIVGGDLKKTIDNGVRNGYRRGYLRNSIVSDPLLRKGPYRNTPSIIHLDLVKGEKLKITVAPKGFGSENTSKIKMFKPTDSVDKIREFVLEAVKEAGANACPPFIIGVGIGATFEKAALLSKEALLRPIIKAHPDRNIARLEKELLNDINRLGIGPMGLGGRTTALGINILTYPTHIAGLPVAVNISCHATRNATRIL